MTDRWTEGGHYEAYMGRWSRPVAHEFVRWLDRAAGSRWLDAGCGSGALAAAAVEHGAGAVIGLDRSPAYAARARAAIGAGAFGVADIQALPLRAESVDAAVSGLVLNFVPEPGLAVSEMARVTRRGGMVAAYLWDYAVRMEFLRRFWDAAVALDPAALHLDEGVRFPLCNRPALTDLFEAAGLAAVEARALDVPTVFRDFDDFWTPFLSGQGPAPGYVAGLDDDARVSLRETLRARLAPATDGSIALVARAWAVRGTRAS